jgi:pimeloyl-ACP methyl ester carboxylesterase
MRLDVHGHAAYAYTGGKAFDATLPCVVFVHGALHDHSGFNLLARWFAHHGQAVLAVDLPGHGASAGPPPASVEQAAHWLWALLDAAGVARAAFVGHSLGSLIALEAAALRPQQARALGLIGTAFPMKVGPALLELAARAPLQAIELVNALSISSWASKPAFPGPGNWVHRARLQPVQPLRARPAGRRRAALPRCAGAGRARPDDPAPPRHCAGPGPARHRAHTALRAPPDGRTARCALECAASAAGGGLRSTPTMPATAQPAPPSGTLPVDPRSFKSFAEFYPFYLGEHANRTCRRLHFVGSSLGLACLGLALLRGQPALVLLGLLLGYAFAWVGHFGFEKNRPASFKRPLYSFMGDWAMFRDICLRRLPF